MLPELLFQKYPPGNFRGFHIEAAVGDHLGDLSGGLEADGVGLVHQQTDVPTQQIRLGQRQPEGIGVILHLPCQPQIVIGRIRRSRQCRRGAEAVVAARQQRCPIDGVAQGHTDLGLGEDLASDVAAQVQENAALGIPQLIIAAVGRIAGCAGIRRGHAQTAELKFIPNLGRGLTGKELNGVRIQGHLRIAPPVVPTVQDQTGALRLQHIRTGALGDLGLTLTAADNGDIQQDPQRVMRAV